MGVANWGGGGGWKGGEWGGEANKDAGGARVPWCELTGRGGGRGEHHSI